MMYGFSSFGGWGLIGMGMMVLFWVAIILLVIWGVRRVFPRQVRSERNLTPEILQQRYAHGEIDTATFEQMRERLQGTEPIPGANQRVPESSRSTF